MNGVQIGKIVHYIRRDRHEGSLGDYAAIISHVWHDDVVSLHVLEADGVAVVHQVGWSDDPLSHSWHWPEECTE